MEEEAGQLLQMKSRSYRTSSKEGCRTALDIAQAACTVCIQSRYLGKALAQWDFNEKERPSPSAVASWSFKEI